MNAATQERADRQHDRRGFEHDARHRHHAAHPIVLDHQVGALLLEQGEIRLVLQEPTDGGLVELPISLGASRAHGWTLAGVQGPKLNAGAIGGARHRPAQRIDLAHQMTLADAADRRVAAHLPERLDALRQQQRATPHAGSRERGLGAGMAATDHDDVERMSKTHRIPAGSKA